MAYKLSLWNTGSPAVILDERTTKRRVLQRNGMVFEKRTIHHDTEALVFRAALRERRLSRCLTWTSRH
jgi:hypothetical protein